ncbi:MAG: hypothetical protein JNL28_14515 [Planctomycetes bacterium]|nr:hypothetical protein [Planctomycetota bacterium]
MKHTLFFLSSFALLLAGSAEAQKVNLNPAKNSQSKAVKRVQPVATPGLFAPAPAVGGADACTTPDVVVGTGTFAFDNTIATTGTQGQAEPLCNIFALVAVDQDVWFTWTATLTGVATVSTCGLTGVDTKIAAYDGNTCPTGAALACSDDDCGFTFQSSISFPCTSGNSYLIQIGTYPGAGGGTGSFSISASNVPLNDDCATPQSISGPGPFTFNNSAATTGAQGQAEPTCNFFGGTAIQKDIWYTWVAPASGLFAVVTRGLTDVDTKAAIYDGSGCPAAAAIGCNDDGGISDLQTTAFFVATAGNTYTIQLGLYQGTTAGGPGEFMVMSTTPKANDNCATPEPVSGQGTFWFDNAFSTTGVEGQTEANCNAFTFTAVESDSWYLWTPDGNGTATISACNGTSTDTKIAVYPGGACPTAGTSLACNDDFCGSIGLQSEVTFTVVCGQTYLIQVGTYPYGGQEGGLGRLDYSIVGTSCSTVGTPFCLGDGTGAPCPCGNTGAVGHGCGSAAFAGGAILSSSGIAGASAGTDTLVLTATDIPGPGLFFQSNGLAGAPINFGDGHLCAAVGIIRLGVVFPTSGVASYPGGLTPNPIHIQGAVSNGQTKHYQCWYRSVPGLCTANNYDLTQGLSFVWGP